MKSCELGRGCSPGPGQGRGRAGAGRQSPHSWSRWPRPAASCPGSWKGASARGRVPAWLWCGVKSPGWGMGGSHSGPRALRSDCFLAGPQRQCLPHPYSTRRSLQGKPLSGSEVPSPSCQLWPHPSPASSSLQPQCRARATLRSPAPRQGVEKRSGGLGVPGRWGMQGTDGRGEAANLPSSPCRRRPAQSSVGKEGQSVGGSGPPTAAPPEDHSLGPGPEPSESLSLGADAVAPSCRGGWSRASRSPRSPAAVPEPPNPPPESPCAPSDALSPRAQVSSSQRASTAHPQLPSQVVTSGMRGRQAPPRAPVCSPQPCAQAGLPLTTPQPPRVLEREPHQ